MRFPQVTTIPSCLQLKESTGIYMPFWFFNCQYLVQHFITVRQTVLTILSDNGQGGKALQFCGGKSTTPMRMLIEHMPGKCDIPVCIHTKSCLLYQKLQSGSLTNVHWSVRKKIHPNTGFCLQVKVLT